MDENHNRVKLYELEADGSWTDKGTGHVTLVDKILTMRSESEENEVLLSSTIKNIEYTLQQETLILWCEDGLDLALSFQEKAGCDEIWNSIVDIQKHSNNEFIDQLPEVKRDNLDELERIFLLGKGQQDFFLERILNTSFLKELVGLFDEIKANPKIIKEQEEEAPVDQPKILNQELNQISLIVKSLFFLNNHALFSDLFDDDIFRKILEILEFDYEYPNGDFLRMYDKTNFKKIVEIEDERIIKRIGKVHKANFIKDVVLARTLEDATFAALSVYISSNQIEILSHFAGNETKIAELFKLIENNIEQTSLDGLLFLEELCGICRPTLSENHDVFYQTLAKLEVFNLLESQMYATSIRIRTVAISIISKIIEFNAHRFRAFLNQPEKLENFVGFFTKEKEQGLISQLGEIIRNLLDSTEKENSFIPYDQNANRFVEKFFSKLMIVLFEPLFIATSENSKTELVLDDQISAQILSLSDIFIFCNETHNAQFQKFLMTHDLLKPISKLLNARAIFIRLAAVRMLRSALVTKNEYYQKLLQKHSIPRLMLQALIATKGSNNLLNSSLLSFFYYIKINDMRSMVVHLGTTCSDLFPKISYTSIFDDLQKRYDQFVDDERPMDIDSTNDHKQSQDDGYSKLDIKQEAYFDNENEEDGADKDQKIPDLSPTSKIPLVPYEVLDEKEEEDDSFELIKTKIVKKKMSFGSVGKKIGVSKRRKT